MAQLLILIIYLSFISLGLPDSLLGAGWPSMYPDLNVPISYAGMLSVIICGGTILSSLKSDALTAKFGTGLVTVFSVATTALALLGFSLSHSFPALCFWAVPYGLGAGSVDASLNNYVALHYRSHHMNWLHCMWGIGASAGPYVMGLVLTQGLSWNFGYRYIGIFQLVLTAILLFSLPLWQKRVTVSAERGEPAKPRKLRDVLAIPGAKAVMLCFFCYCSIEQTAILWGASYLHLEKGLSADAVASFSALFCLGVALGRGVSGFAALRWNDTQMITAGLVILLTGMVLLCLPGGVLLSLLAFLLLGLGCAPTFPCLIHSTPARFGAEASQSIIGVEMASAYLGSCLMPPFFGLIANHLSPAWLPLFLAVNLTVMVISFRRLTK